jgi:hypothetical protein
MGAPLEYRFKASPACTKPLIGLNVQSGIDRGTQTYEISPGKE